MISFELQIISNASFFAEPAYFKEHYYLVLKHNLHVHLWKGYNLAVSFCNFCKKYTKSVSNDGSSQNFHSSNLLKHFDIFAGESLS